MLEHLDDPEFVGASPGLRSRVARAAQRQRQRRRTVVTAVTLVPLLAVAGGAVYVRSQSKDNGRFQVGSVATTAPTPTETPDVQPPVSQAPATEFVTEPAGDVATADGSDVDGSTVDSPPNSLDRATPANLVPSNITWKVLDAESPEAITTQLDRSQRYGLLQAPNQEFGANPEVNLYEQVDGTWNKVEFDSAGMVSVVSGDTVYGIGRDPAAAGGSSLSFGTFDVATASWQLHDVPEQAVPYESDNLETNMYTEGAPVDGGMVVSITSFYLLQRDRFPQLPSYTDSWTYYDGPYVDGQNLVYFFDCDDSAVSDSYETDPDISDIERYRPFCSEKSFIASELGITQADLDALSTVSTSTLWRLTADSMVPFSPPGVSPDALSAMTPDEGLLVTFGGHSFTLGKDGTVTELFGDVTLPIFDSLGVGKVARGQAEGSGVGVTGRYMLTGTPDSPTQITDVLNAVTTPNMRNPELTLQAVGDTGTVMVATGTVAYDDATDDTPPSTLTDSGYTLVIGTDGYELFDATGTKLPTSQDVGMDEVFGGDEPIVYSLGPGDPGKTSLSAFGLSDTDMFTSLAMFDVDPESLPGTASVTRSVIVTSNDGVNIAVDDPDKIVRDTIGLDDHQHVSFDPWFSVHPISTVNGQIVLSAVITTAEDMGSPDGHNIILVGTPN